MHRNAFITFVRAYHGDYGYVWSRTYPSGRQRRELVACHRLEGVPEDSTLEDWVAALLEALEQPPLFTI